MARLAPSVTVGNTGTRAQPAALAALARAGTARLLRRAAARLDATDAASQKRSEALAEVARRVGDDWRDQPYYEDVERYMDASWDADIWPMIRRCNFNSVVDVAAGHGRNTRKLLDVADRVVVSDINAENIEVCRRRFGDDPRVSYLLGDGFSLKEIGDATITLFYSYDAMVHFDSDVVRAYLGEAARVLVPGGHAFIHHSNYTGNPGGDVHDNPQWRNFMSRELFAHYARKTGLDVLEQRVVDWGPDEQIDCISLLQRPR